MGTSGWEQAGPALTRQTETLLDLLDDLGAKATFFILGMAARAHPELVREIVQRGHEIGSHGDQHRPVHSQTPEQFAADLSSARQTIEELTGLTPRGYRAPAFSITQQSPWAYDILAEEGFAYDASQHDSPRIRDRITTAAATPHAMKLTSGATLWEFPVAVSETYGMRVPVGGASYWALLPNRVVLSGLRRAGPFGGLYLHPHELDPRPLRAQLPRGTTVGQRLHGVLRAAHRNSARRTAASTLRAIAREFRLIPYGEAYGRLSDRAPARP